MGLDISYYRRVVLTPDAPLDADGSPVDWDTFTKVRVSPEYADRAYDLTDGGVYLTDDGDGFRAGSYGGYGAWRETLAKLAGYALGLAGSLAVACGERYPHSAVAWQAGGGPFWELVSFTDCDGVIGAPVSAKLAADFALFQDRADDVGGWFAESYARWRTAFETAADRGFVLFH